MKIEKNVPLKYQVSDRLREVIRKDYPNGEQMLNENELAESLGVSRGTVSQALTILAGEGLIIRKQGAGTFSNPQILRLNVRADLPFTVIDLVKNAGFSPTVKFLGYEEVLPDRETAQNLKISEQEPVIEIRRIVFADGDPAIYTIDRIPKKLFIYPVETLSFTERYIDFLKEYCDIELAYTSSNMIPVNADDEISELLHVDRNKALLKCEDIHYDTENRPVVTGTIWYSEKIRFSVVRKNYY